MKNPGDRHLGNPEDFFEKRIRPLLAENCLGCHGREKQKANLRLDHISTILKGGDGGPAIVPGMPEKSRLLEAVRYENVDLQMPPKSKLPREKIADLETWIKLGAPWPEEEPPDVRRGEENEFDLQKMKGDHWAWNPIRAPEPPALENRSWPRNSVDRFVLEKLEEKGLTPAPPADRRTLIRRLHFDIIGLPPTPVEVESFVHDSSPGALESLVDGLLESPHFGERWGRHWLDLVRYAETYGHEFDYEIQNAFRYRDYVIRAFNSDLPYDQFVLEHLAGDLLDSPRLRPGKGSNESALGTGFFWLGEQTHAPVDVRQHQADRIDNQIDVLTRTFLGLTVSCARCHDHKFDAISTRDYYALFGIIESSSYRQIPIDPPGLTMEKVEKLKEIKQRLRSVLGARWAREASGAGEELAHLRKGLPKSVERERVTSFKDFRDGNYDHCFSEGPAFGSRPAAAGTLVILGEGDETKLRLLPGGWAHSASVSPRLQGALRSATFTIEKERVHVRVLGRDSRVNLVVDGFNLIRGPIYDGLKIMVKNEEPHWITFDVTMWKGHRGYLEFVDLDVPDPASKAKSSGTRGYLAVERILFSDRGPPAAVDGAAVLPPVDGDAFSSCEEEVSEAVSGFREGSLGADQARLLDWLLAKGLLTAEGEKVGSLVEEYRRVEGSIPEPTMALVMGEGTGLDGRVFRRGRHQSPGELVPRRFLEVLGKSRSGFGNGSGRLELARRMTDPVENPFVPRVMVNRVWHHLFGRGIVATVDNLGIQGEPPTHPELLDWLSDRFIRDGWSVKKLIRTLVLSSTYQMASRSSERNEEVDPANLLLHRMRIRRLEGEVIRDSILAVSGRLDRTMFGPGVKIHLTPFMEGRGRPDKSGALDGERRRSIYVEVRRNFLSPMMLCFDTPIPFNTMGRRSNSNVPAQALILMNDPFVLGECRNWARRILKERQSLEDRILGMYLSAFARPPTKLEMDKGRTFLHHQGEAYGLRGARGLSDPRPWTDLCHVLMNVKEFIFIR